MKEINIAVTGLNNVDSPGPGVAVIRGLRESPHFKARIVGLAYENLEPGLYMPGVVDAAYMIPYPSLGHETLLSRLVYIQQREKIDVIIPNFDAELFSFIKLAPQLLAMGIHTLMPTLEQFEARLKGNLNDFGNQYGINVPRSKAVYNLDELLFTLREFTYPVMIKGKFYEASKAYTQDQAIAHFYKISAKWGTPIIVQQFVKGEEFNVTALGDGKGTLVGAVAMRKTYITDAGKGWAGISIDDADLLNMADRVITRTKWGGGMELELIKEDSTGTVYLIEINPRFPAWIYLAVGCGQNHPDALVRLALGETVAPFDDYAVGKMFVRYAYDLICDLKIFEQIATTGEI